MGFSLPCGYRSSASSKACPRLIGKLKLSWVRWGRMWCTLSQEPALNGLGRLKNEQFVSKIHSLWGGNVSFFTKLFLSLGSFGCMRRCVEIGRRPRCYVSSCVGVEEHSNQNIFWIGISISVKNVTLVGRWTPVRPLRFRRNGFISLSFQFQGLPSGFMSSWWWFF